MGKIKDLENRNETGSSAKSVQEFITMEEVFEKEKKGTIRGTALQEGSEGVRGRVSSGRELRVQKEEKKRGNRALPCSAIMVGGLKSLQKRGTELKRKTPGKLLRDFRGEGVGKTSQGGEGSSPLEKMSLVRGAGRGGTPIFFGRKWRGGAAGERGRWMISRRGRSREKKCPKVVVRGGGINKVLGRSRVRRSGMAF